MAFYLLHNYMDFIVPTENNQYNDYILRHIIDYILRY